MKRDMDLVRRILLAAADMPACELLESIEGASDAEFGMHVLWLREAGLVRAIGSDMLDGQDAAITRLTWDGCEFVDTIRDDNLWAKAKANVLKPSMSFTFDLLKDYLKAEITQGFPTLNRLR